MAPTDDSVRTPALAGDAANGRAFCASERVVGSRPAAHGPIGNAFNGEVKGVQLSIKDDPNNSDHLVKPEEAIRAALGRQ